MKLATAANNSPDGMLVVVSNDGSRFLIPENIQTLQQAIENWNATEKQCQHLSQRLKNGEGESTDTLKIIAPLPAYFLPTSRG